MSRYPDCESCAFYEVEEAICEDCDEADQWEPSDPLDYGKVSQDDSKPRCFNSKTPHCGRKLKIAA